MTTEIDQPAASGFNRRRLLQGGVAGVAAVAFAGLAQGTVAGASGPRPRANGLGYGPLAPVVDDATGLELLSLPAGFRYISAGWTGKIMDDGQITPGAHDGMAVVAARGDRLTLVRNHELTGGTGTPTDVPGGVYDPAYSGGTSNMVFDRRSGRFVEDWASLTGTIRNCAGGPTPWGSWITCEETFHQWRTEGFNHGYIFDVPGNGTSNAVPIRAAGRFSHEAVAVDTRTGIVYETEDDNPSGLFAYHNPGGRRSIRDGGELYAMVVDGTPRFDLRGGFAIGTTFGVTWQLVTDPEGQQGRAFDAAPDAAMISRGEGAWYDQGIVYFVSTDGGAARRGQVWALDPHADSLTLVYESPSGDVLNAPDNIAVSRRGGLLLCEDGSFVPQRLIGLSKDGEVFEFARNNVILGAGDIDVIDARYPGTKEHFGRNPIGDFTGSEWAGATFHDDWLFVNIQTPGVTFAITGPWGNGIL